MSLSTLISLASFSILISAFITNLTNWDTASKLFLSNSEKRQTNQPFIDLYYIDSSVEIHQTTSLHTSNS